MMIRAVHPQVDEIGGGPEHARQVRPAHHAVRGPVRLQQREDLFAMPAAVALHPDVPILMTTGPSHQVTASSVRSRSRCSERGISITALTRPTRRPRFTRT